jgi:response regulator of citrate/malate metabolism
MAAKRKILIVEDDKMLCTIFEMFIKQLGHEIIGISQTGTEAINLCSLQRPDVVLMDIHLEGEINGIDAAKNIHHSYDIPVIYITSDIEETTIKRAIYKNTYGFLMKPIYQDTLGVAIEFALAKHEYDKTDLN